jgi:hypothetical protein
MSNQSVPVGLMTPYTEDTAGLSRRRTIDAYASRGATVPNLAPLAPTIINNVPMVGFRISRALRRGGWRSNTAVIRIEDPRGFELEINAVNMIMITDENTIQNGEILCECVWGRDGSDNVLLPVNSSPYLIALANTKRSTTKTSLRTVDIGDEVLTVRGETGVYLGPMYPISITRSVNMSDNVILAHSKKRHVIRTTNAKGAVRYEGFSTFQVSDIITKIETPLLAIDAHQQMCSDLLTMKAFAVDHKPEVYSSRCLGFSIGVFSINSAQLDLMDESTVDEYKNSSVSRTYNETNTFIGSYQDQFYWLHSGNFDGRRLSSGSFHVSGRGSVTANTYLAFKVSESMITDQATLHFINGSAATMINHQDVTALFRVKVQIFDTKTKQLFTVLL